MAQLISPSKYHKTINGEELLRQREAAGMSQQDVADNAGVSRQFISQIESPGDDKDWKHEITLDFAERIKNIFRK